MTTPFFVVDHKVGPQHAIPFEEKRIIRRGAPDRLTFAPDLRQSLPATGLFLVAPQPVRPPAPIKSPGASGAGWLARLFRGLRHAPS